LGGRKIQRFLGRMRGGGREKEGRKIQRFLGRKRGGGWKDEGRMRGGRERRS